MSLKMQTIRVSTINSKQLTCTMPAEHIYPFIIHRSVGEYLEKKSGDRIRYSKKHMVTHTMTGANIGVCPSYGNALQLIELIKHLPIFLMPTIELVTTHPDWSETARYMGDLKSRLCI